jgi:flagellum-specific peptidoglycan hydrolase FlgJ
MKILLNNYELNIKRWLINHQKNALRYVMQNKGSVLFLVFLSIMAFRQISELTFGNTKEKTAATKKKGNPDMSTVLSDLIGSVMPEAKPSSLRSKTSAAELNMGNTYSNVSYWGTRTDDDTRRAEKRAKQLQYVERYVKIAQEEMQKFGIPASISLAQGLVESNAGESKLSLKNNNHFGMKCFSRSCSKGHCSNFTDDTHKDFFLKFQNPWMSFRAHSKLLKAGRYRRLFRLNAKDYKSWAMGLKALGYATDPHYALSLIRTIEDLNLNQYD